MGGMVHTERVSLHWLVWSGWTHLTQTMGHCLNQLLGQPVCCEDPTHNSNGTSSGGETHLEDFGPFWVCIHNDKEHLPEKEASKVHMNSLPCLGGPHLWVQRDHRWGTLFTLTWNASFEQAMDVLVESRPPGIAACDSLHEGHSWMVAVQFSQDSALKLLRMTMRAAHNWQSPSTVNSMCLYGLEWLQICGDNSRPSLFGVLYLWLQICCCQRWYALLWPKNRHQGLVVSYKHKLPSIEVLVQFLHTKDQRWCLLLNLCLVLLTGRQCIWSKVSRMFAAIWQGMGNHSTDTIGISNQCDWQAGVIVH